MNKVNFASVCVAFSFAMMFTASCTDLSKAKEGDIETISAGDIDIEMVYVEPGEFRMGATAEQQGTNPNEVPSHDVQITKGYWIGQFEVTQEQWETVMGHNPSLYKGKDGKAEPKLPVTDVKWFECQIFVNKLSELSGYKFRLPTEAEWEYAARGAHKADGLMYAGSIYVDNVANYKNNSNGLLHATGEFMPNKLELRDMSGNVAELVQDNFEKYKDSLYVDPCIVTSDTLPHVARGGSYISGQTGVRTASRESIMPDFSSMTIGLRVAMEAVE